MLFCFAHSSLKMKQQEERAEISDFDNKTFRRDPFSDFLRFPLQRSANFPNSTSRKSLRE